MMSITLMVVLTVNLEGRLNKGLSRVGRSVGMSMGWGVYGDYLDYLN